MQAGALRKAQTTTCALRTCPFRQQRSHAAMGRKPGERFGSLVAESYDNGDKPGVIFANCRCDCGSTVAVRLRSLRSGQTKTCGCGIGVKVTWQYGGESLAAYQKASRVGVNQNTLRGHLVAGLAVDEAIALSKRSRIRYESMADTSLLGVPVTLDQLAELSGLTKKRARSQMARGLSTADIIAGKRMPISTAHKLAGQKFGRLLAIEPNGTHPTRRCLMWRCACDCGQEWSAAGVDLKRGHTTSCGCAVNERIGALRRGLRKSVASGVDH